MKKSILVVIFILLAVTASFAETIYRDKSPTGSLVEVKSTDTEGLYTWYAGGARLEVRISLEPPVIDFDSNDGYKARAYVSEDGTFVIEDIFGGKRYLLDGSLSANMLNSIIGHYLQQQESDTVDQ